MADRLIYAAGPSREPSHPAICRKLQVIRNRAVEQERILRHHADETANLQDIEFPQVLAVYSNASRVISVVSEKKAETSPRRAAM